VAFHLLPSFFRLFRLLEENLAKKLGKFLVKNIFGEKCFGRKCFGEILAQKFWH
jgi:hypothetical protein